jgi:ubiquinol-cytochrome c reductase iron-sulfur subunit
VSTRGKRTAGKTAGVAFAVSAFASLGLMITYWVGGQPQLEGVMIFFALGGLAVGFVVYANELLPGGHFVEERHPLEPPSDEHEEAVEDVEAESEGLGRRKFIGYSLGGALTALGAAAVFPIRSLGEAPGEQLLHTSWTEGSVAVTTDGERIKAADLEVGGFQTIFPEGKTDLADSQAVLIRVDPEAIEPLPGREDWSPDGYIAFSQVCTHAGCPVKLYEPETYELLCPCHQSIFKVTDGARATYGPATRALPQLPIEIDDGGYIVARGDFSEPIGPGFWNLG